MAFIYIYNLHISNTAFMLFAYTSANLCWDHAYGMHHGAEDVDYVTQEAADGCESLTVNPDRITVLYLVFSKVCTNVACSPLTGGNS